MYYSITYRPSKEDQRKEWQSEIYRLKNEIVKAESFIEKAREEIQRIERLIK